MNEKSKITTLRVISLFAGIASLFIPIIGIGLGAAGIAVSINIKENTIEGKHYMVFNIVVIACSLIMQIYSFIQTLS